MPHQHKGRGQNKEKVIRFQKRYGMTRAEWRELKKNNPKEANLLRMKSAQEILKIGIIKNPIISL